VQAGQRWPRYAGTAALPRAQEHPAHRQVHRNGARPVQGLLEGLMTAKLANTKTTLSDSLRDDVKRLRDVLSDELNRLFAGVKLTVLPVADSATTEDSGAVFDAHVRAEFVEQSVDATMATMTDTPYVTHVPVMTGGHGQDEVREFY